MRIIASKRDDILKQKGAYEKDVAERKSRFNSQHNEFRSAQRSILSDVENQVKNELSGVALDLNIEAEFVYGGYVRLTVRDENHLHSEDKALSWNWSAMLNEDGTLVKDSGSWSGLQAVTESQIADLQKVLNAVTILNRIDWKTLLHKSSPKYGDYVTEKDPKYDSKPDFDRMLQEVDIEDAIETGKLIRGHGYRWYDSRATVYYKVVKETNAQYEVLEIREGDVDKEEKYWPGSYRVRKEIFLNHIINHPLETLEV